MAVIVDGYNYLFDEVADNRVKSWTYMAGPAPLAATIGLYLLGLKVGRRVMEKREPFELKTIIFWYNVFQIVVNATLVHQYLAWGYLNGYKLTGELVDYSDDPTARRMLNVIYCTFWLKIFDFLETFFFLLRKKFKQISPLHVNHHVFIAVILWLAVKYAGGGDVAFALMLNSGTHVLMYTYYLLSSLGPEWQKRLQHWKPRLTIIQIVHQAVVLVHLNLALGSESNIPNVTIMINNVLVAYVLYQFSSFYIKSYLKKAAKHKGPEEKIL